MLPQTTQGRAMKMAQLLFCGSAAMYGIWKLSTMILQTPEISLPERQLKKAAAFEQRVNGHSQDLPPHLTLEDACGLEGEVGDRANRVGAEHASCGLTTSKATAFMRYWVAELRVEFPQRQDRPSDRAVMAKWLAGKLRAHGVRTMHIANMVPRCVALAINKSRAEHEADQEAEAAKIRTLGERWAYNVRRALGAQFRPDTKPGC